MKSKLKVYELAKELGLESQALVDSIQRLGIDVKNPMNFLGSEEVRTIREHFLKQKPVKEVPKATPAKTPVTERRVGTSVIRRRVKSSSEPAEPAAGVEMVPVDSALVEASHEASSLLELEKPTELSEAMEEPVAEEPQESASKDEEKTAETSTKSKRFFPSIIKKVATSEYLGQVVGPKPVKKEEESFRVKTEKKPRDVAVTNVEKKDALPKRVREIEVLPVEPAKEVKRRSLQRQDAVFRSADYLRRELVHATKKRKSTASRLSQKTQITTPAEHKRIIEMSATITVGELAKGMGIKATQVISKLMALGVTATINDKIDFDTASLCSHEYKYEVKQLGFKEEAFIPEVSLAPEALKHRGPVVTIMGHVDHGKTSLLDAIRKTKVALGEAGGITQHIGAYTVDLPKGRITFLDTPGHEAFTAMRARGAKVTDIVILVVSAVDGVMPQTLESVSHAKAANVSIIVAVNKMDLPDANSDRIKQTLAGHGLNPEEWGGDTLYVNVSAKTGKGVDSLLESILLQAEVLELKANFDVAGKAFVIESRLDKNRGPIAAVLVRHGKLSLSDLLVCGAFSGKIRAMNDSLGRKISEAVPSDAVEILGLSGVPNVGDELSVVTDERMAREIASQRSELGKNRVDARPKMTLEQILAAPAGEKELRLVLKADVQGSSEALREALSKLPQEKVKLKLLYVGIGGVTESDVMLAAASGAMVLGFNVRPELKAMKLAEKEKVLLKTYTIIYDLLDDTKKLLEGMLDVVVHEKVIGRAEVRNIFHIPRVGTVAGSAVLDGKVVRGCFLRLLRDSRVIFEGKISSLRRFKDDVKEVASGYECGIGIENFNDLKQGDQFEAFVKEEQKGTL